MLKLSQKIIEEYLPFDTVLSFILQVSPRRNLLLWNVYWQPRFRPDQ